VIEYGAAGLLVLTTDISDVRSIFGDSAIYLKFDNPMELIDLLRIIVSNREEARAYSQNGFKAVKNIFMPHITGKMLADFIFE
jgi:glycosyltransferase involved in cell wall biosynthesis